MSRRLAIEIILGVGFFFFIGIQFKEGLNLLYLPILIFGIRYGKVPAIVTAVLSAVLLSLWRLRLDLNLSPQVLLFILAGFVSGLISEGHIKRSKVLEEMLRKAEEEIKTLKKRLNALNKNPQSLLESLFGETANLSLFLDFAVQNYTENGERLLRNLPKFIEEIVQAKVSIYLLEDQKPVFKAGEIERELGKSLLFKEVLKQKRLITIKEFGEGVKDEPIAAFPLTSEEGILGVFTVEDMPFYQFRITNLRFLSVLGEWMAQKIKETKKLKQVRREAEKDPLSGAFFFPHFKDVFSRERERAKRYKTPLSLIILRILDYDSLDKQQQLFSEVFLERVMEKGLRKSDQYFKHKKRGYFLILLPHTPKEGGEKVKARIKEEASHYGMHLEAMIASL